mmetsp:Transcript_90823/g.111185  ORF Transcript_90823/g.111185 Transcript_90823/m.111185 type:complete len:96 (+) Transcript_90823:3-290(+)
MNELNVDIGIYTIRHKILIIDENDFISDDYKCEYTKFITSNDNLYIVVRTLKNIENIRYGRWLNPMESSTLVSGIQSKKNLLNVIKNITKNYIKN